MMRFVRTPIAVAVLATWLGLGAGSAVALPAGVVDHGNYTTHAVAGLEFLDLTLSVGRSHHDIVANGANYLGSTWRLATLQEVLDLWSAFIPAADQARYFGPSPRHMLDTGIDDPVLREFQSLVGVTEDVDVVGTRAQSSWGFTATFEGNSVAAPLVSWQDYNGTASDVAYWGAGLTPPDRGIAWVGAWLVRTADDDGSGTVPEPGSIGLAMLALAAGVAVRWARRAR